MSSSEEEEDLNDHWDEASSPVICHTGGALGADVYWSQCCADRKIRVVHWQIARQFNDTFQQVRIPASLDLDEGENRVERANEVLKRNVQKYKRFLAENWCQVKYAQQIFAVGNLISYGERGEKGFVSRCGYPMIDGGTAYAVQMGIDKGIEVNVFDQRRKQWNRFDLEQSKWIPVSKPTIVADFAGIGTSKNLSDAGKRAIKEIVYRSFPLPKTEDSSSFESDEEDGFVFE